MKVTFVKVPAAERIPEEWVNVAVFPGESEFPLCTFYATKFWWENFQSNPQVEVQKDSVDSRITEQQ